MTTPRENLLKILRHREPEWVPIAGMLSPYGRPSREGMDPALAEALGNVQWGDESIVLFSRHLGLDIMDWYRTPVRVTRRKVEVVTRQDEDNGTVRNTWHTPRGDLAETIVVCRDDKTGAESSNWTEHPVKGPADLEKLAAVFEDELVEPDPEALAQTRARKEFIGDDGLLLAPFAGTPLGQMYRVYSGVATLAYLWADAPDALRDLFAVMERNYLQKMRVAGESEIDVFVGVDDTSTTAISPAMFAACNLELTDERVRVARERGKFYFHHSCGHIRDLLPLYRWTGMDAVHAFTVPPVGNVTVGEGRQLLGNRITIMTGVKPDRAIMKQVIREAAPWDHFILSLGGGHRTLEETRIILEQTRSIIERCRG